MVLLTLGLGVAACGSDSESDSSTPTTTTAATAAATTTLATATTAATATTVADAATTTVEPESKDCPTFTEKDDLPLKICDSGAKVLEVQQGLADADEGFDLVVDGFFGAQTRNAVLEFQAANGLEVDGVVGPLTFSKLFPT